MPPHAAAALTAAGLLHGLLAAYGPSRCLGDGGLAAPTFRLENREAWAAAYRKDGHVAIAAVLSSRQLELYRAELDQRMQVLHEPSLRFAGSVGVGDAAGCRPCRRCRLHAAAAAVLPLSVFALFSAYSLLQL